MTCFWNYLFQQGGCFNRPSPAFWKLVGAVILISLGASYFPDDPAPKKEPAAAAPLASDSGKATGIAEGSKAVESSRGAEKSATSKDRKSVV